MWRQVVSQSPSETRGKSSQDAFMDAILETNILLRRGMSLSGSERNCSFINTGQMRFANDSSVTGLDILDDARGVGVVDWDGDGDLDL
jgi:hypothetical protein